MRIIVPIKQVPETTSVTMDDETGTIIREGVEAIVNPLDLYAIETAIQIRESLPPGGCEITTISMGPMKAMTALKEAIAMGIDSGVLLTDKSFAGSDTWATSYVLATAIGKCEPFDLIICGERATDGDTGQVPPGIAAWLDLPVVTYVAEVESLDQHSARVRRLIEGGYEILDMDLPGVLTVVKEIASPRLPTLRGKQRARRLDVPAWGSGDLEVRQEWLGLNGSPTRVIKIFRPTVARTCEKITPNDDRQMEQAADRLVSFLQERQLL
jgi:electron transfer flavoprotein beta subunit